MRALLCAALLVVLGCGSTARPEAPRPPSAKPTLVKNACERSFVHTATVDEATVVVELTVAEDSEVKNIVVIDENPTGQGFGAAAMTCMAESSFAAARDAAGKPLARTTRLHLRFVR